MICQNCKNRKTYVKTSRLWEKSKYRRNECRVCGNTFNSYEIINKEDFPDREDGWRSRALAKVRSKLNTPPGVKTRWIKGKINGMEKGL